MFEEMGFVVGAKEGVSEEFVVDEIDDRSHPFITEGIEFAKEMMVIFRFLVVLEARRFFFAFEFIRFDKEFIRVDEFEVFESFLERFDIFFHNGTCLRIATSFPIAKGIFFVANGEFGARELIDGVLECFL